MAQTREGGLWQKAQQFLLEIPVEVLTGRSGAHRIRKACAFVWMVVRGFAANRGPMRAAALAYTTLLALVPLLVVALSVSKNLLKETTGQVVPRLIDQAVATVIPQLEHLPLPDDAYGPPAPGQAVMSSQAWSCSGRRSRCFWCAGEGGYAFFGQQWRMSYGFTSSSRGPLTM